MKARIAASARFREEIRHLKRVNAELLEALEDLKGSAEELYDAAKSRVAINDRFLRDLNTARAAIARAAGTERESEAKS